MTTIFNMTPKFFVHLPPNLVQVHKLGPQLRWQNSMQLLATLCLQPNHSSDDLQCNSTQPCLILLNQVGNVM